MPGIPVFVYACDPISQAGMASQLRGRPELRVVEDQDLDAAAVAVVVADDVNDETARSIKALQRNGCPRVVVVATQLDDGGLLLAVEAGACGLLRRAEATPDQLAGAVVRAAAGDGALPPDLLGRLLEQVGNIQRQILEPRGFRVSGLTEREVQVLRLVADGHNTAEIARQLAYSERTIKNVIQDVITRFQLRNRSHAVAYAVRQGFI
ncbi:MAG TPA: LuxR C-terminal-related transcriptional regulator [Actinomycetota bacterium]|nr:LuxR C-terminal-related transcriptional regulator [Actinomycetota bacterium]